MTLTTPHQPAVIRKHDALLDLWIGDSNMMGLEAHEADIIFPDEVDSHVLPSARYWDKYGDAANWLNGTGTFAWDSVPRTHRTHGGDSITFFPYGAALAMADGVAGLEVRGDADSDFYHAAVLGISSSALSDDLTVSADVRTHWSPLVTGAGTGTDYGALQLLKDEYLDPGLAALAAEGRRTRLGTVFFSCGGDALSAYAAKSAAKDWLCNFNMMMDDLERYFGVYNIPVVIIGIPAAWQDATTGVSELDTVLAQQQLAADVRDNTLFFDTRKFATKDKVHFTGQAAVDIGKEAVKFRYNSPLGLVNLP